MSSRVKKRPRTAGNDDDNGNDANDKNEADDDDKALLESMMVVGNAEEDDDDFDFDSYEKRREADAERRRKLRRQRLEQLKQKEQAAETTEEGQPTTNNMQQQKEMEAAGGEQEKTTKKKKKVEQGRDMEKSNHNIVTAISSQIMMKQQLGDDGGVSPAKNDDNDDDDDDFDMFSSSVSPVVVAAVAQNDGGGGGEPNSSSTKAAAAAAATTTGRGQEQEDWDDSEGYYKAVIGEIIALENVITKSNSDADEQQHSSNITTSAAAGAGAGDVSFRVLGSIGKGVFSTVLKCSTISNTTSLAIPHTVALKCIRHNETMNKAAIQEIRFLQKLTSSNNNSSSSGIVPLLLPATNSSAIIEYRGHVLLCFPFVEFNLRDVLQKFGKGVGLSLQAVRSYFGQLLAAVTHLKKHSIIHADIKPDNVLVSADFSKVQLADFGSAFSASSPEAQVTPYLVSRFYRAPEIILGLVPTLAVDLWSLAVSIAELYLGNVLFMGTSNNDMLYTFMQHIGPFSNRMIRQHLLTCDKHPNVPRQFERSSEGNTYSFKQETTDPVTGSALHKLLPLYVSTTATTSNNKKEGSNKKKFPLATPLHNKLLKARAAKDSRVLVMQFSDLLQKCLTLDPNRRIDLRDALRHEFFKQAATTAGTTATTAASTAK